MFLPGAIQSFTGMIISYPFDTIKVKMQKYPTKYTSTYSYLINTIETRGICGLYKGIQVPLFITVIKRGLQYDFYEKLNKRKMNYYLSGAITGVSCSVIGCPMHYIKINMQIYNHQSIYYFIKNTYKEKGIKPFYHGIKIDCLKESTFGCCYLGTYGYLREKFPKTPAYHFLAGGLSSSLTWMLFFPLDALRTNIMTNKNNNISENLTKMINNRSILKLWKGLTPALLKIFPLSATSMLTYEYTRKILGDK
jgi:solute carrier family 25 (mitochondrial carnitine/acylcarnitine transporter), member 20/29